MNDSVRLKLSRRNKLAIMFSIIVSLNHLGIVTPPPSYVTTAFAFVCIIVMYKNGGYKIENKSKVFLLFLPFTILLANPDPVFRSWQRLALYASFFAIGSPLIQSGYARSFRRDSLYTICAFCVFIGVGSFIAYFFEFSAQTGRALKEGIDADMYNAGYFSGIARLSMSLGPLAGIGAISLIYYALMKRKFYYYLGAIPCIASVMFSASRAAFLATIAGALFMLYKYSKSKSTFAKYIVTVSLCGFLSFPIWGSAMSGLTKKQLSHKDDSELFDSRASKFEYRVKEFVSSPIWGIGFSAIDTEIGDYYDHEKGTIEPGSSWLAILSMTGLVGFLLFFRMYKHSFDILKDSNEQVSVLLMAVFILISVHMFVEGYIFATGNPLCYYLVLFIGCSYDLIVDNSTT